MNVLEVDSAGATVTGALAVTSDLSCSGSFSVSSGSFSVNNTNGDGTFTGNVNAASFKATSDRNLKENIKELENSLDTISQVKGYEFNFKNTGDLSKGVIAQEVEEVIPSAVSTNDSGIKSVDYLQFIPYLIESVKELKSEIETLKSA